MHEQKHATQNMKFANNEYFHTILQCIPKGHTCMPNLIKSKQEKTAGVYHLNVWKVWKRLHPTSMGRLSVPRSL